MPTQTKTRKLEQLIELQKEQNEQNRQIKQRALRLRNTLLFPERKRTTSFHSQTASSHAKKRRHSKLSKPSQSLQSSRTFPSKPESENWNKSKMTNRKQPRGFISHYDRLKNARKHKKQSRPSFTMTDDDVDDNKEDIISDLSLSLNLNRDDDQSQSQCRSRSRSRSHSFSARRPYGYTIPQEFHFATANRMGHRKAQILKQYKAERKKEDMNRLRQIRREKAERKRRVDAMRKQTQRMHLPIKQSITKHCDRLRNAKSIEKSRGRLKSNATDKDGEKEPLFWASRARQRRGRSVSNPHFMAPVNRFHQRSVSARSHKPRRSHSHRESTRTIPRRVQTIKVMKATPPLSRGMREVYSKSNEKRAKSARSVRTVRSPCTRTSVQRQSDRYYSHQRPQSAGTQITEFNGSRSISQRKKLEGLTSSERQTLQDMKRKLRTGTQVKPRKSKGQIRSRYSFRSSKRKTKTTKSVQQKKPKKNKRPTISVRIPQLQTETATKVSVSGDLSGSTEGAECTDGTTSITNGLNGSNRVIERQRELLNKRLLLTPIAERDLDDVAIEQILMEDVTTLSDQELVIREMNEEKVEEEEKERSDEIKIDPQHHVRDESNHSISRRLRSRSSLSSLSSLNHLDAMQNVHGLLDNLEMEKQREFQLESLDIDHLGLCPSKQSKREFVKMESPVQFVSKARCTNDSVMNGQCNGNGNDLSTERMNSKENDVITKEKGKMDTESCYETISRVSGGEMVKGLQHKFEKLDNLFLEIAERIDAFDDCSSSFDFSTKFPDNL